MYFLKTVFLLLVLGTGFNASPFQSPKEVLKVKFIWKDDFSKREKEKIKTWLTGVSEAIAQTFGAYPFTVKLYIHHANAREPVPWAETSRMGEQAVHFHIDTRFSLEDFQKDWIK